MTTSTFKQPADFGEQIVGDYQMHELSNNVDDASQSGALPIDGFNLVPFRLNYYLMLQSNSPYRRLSRNSKYFQKRICMLNFRIEHDDCLVRVYIWFIFFWPSTTSLVQLLLICSTESQRKALMYGIEIRKLDPDNQLFMALVKLRLNLMTKRYRSLG